MGKSKPAAKAPSEAEQADALLMFQQYQYIFCSKRTCSPYVCMGLSEDIASSIDMLLLGQLGLSPEQQALVKNKMPFGVNSALLLVFFPTYYTSIDLCVCVCVCRNWRVIPLHMGLHGWGILIIRGVAE